LDLAKLLPSWVVELAPPPRATVAVARALPLVIGDAQLLHQVVHHLVRNALTFAPPDTAVKVDLRAGGTARVGRGVGDRGRGLPPRGLGRVFEPFFRTDLAPDRAVQGVGIGLALVRRIVELHHGHVHVVSAPGQGTRFTVTLPTAAAPPAH